MAAPSINGTTSGTTTSPAATCTLPACSTGDMLVLWVNCNADVTITVSSLTWTKEASSHDRYVGSYSFPEPETRCWTATATSASAGPVVTVSHSGAAARLTYVGLCLTPCSVDAADETGGGGGFSGTTSATIAGHSTAGADRLVLVGMGAEADTFAAAVTVGGWANASLAGFAEAAEGSFSSGGSFGATMAVAAGTKAAAGAVGNTTATLSSASFYSGGSISFASAVAVRGLVVGSMSLG